jgi:hypothetical protein
MLSLASAAASISCTGWVGWGEEEAVRNDQRRKRRKRRRKSSQTQSVADKITVEYNSMDF